MNGEQGNQENYIVSKKNKKIDQEEDNPKKNKGGKKNKNRNQEKEQKKIYEDQEQQSQAKILSQTQKNRKNMLSQLCDMYPNYKKETVEKYLKESNYNIQIAAQRILQTQEDKQEQNRENKQEKPKQNSTKKKKKNELKEQLNYEAINDLLGQIYELSGNQFEQLFNQITQMIKEDQKQRGKGQIQINNFVDNCASAKQTILVGLIQIFQMDDDICIDEHDPIYLQTQTFLWDLAVKGQKQQIHKLQDFPTLGSSNNGKGSIKAKQANQKSIVTRTQESYNQNKVKKQQTQYFSSSNKSRPIIFDQFKQHSIFNVDNSQRSQDDLRILHKQYNNVSINRLKIVYKRMEGDFNLCRTFLDRFYGKGKAHQPVAQRFVQSNYQKRKARINYMNTFKKQSQSQIDYELQQWTYRELRDQIQHLYKLREVFRLTSQKINNSNQRKELLRLAQQKAPLAFIRKLSKASRVRLINQAMKNNPLYVDLHGYRQEEVLPVLEGLIASIKDQFDRGNQKIHSRVRKIANKTQCILQVMTGKGRHSQYGESVLKPHIINWAKSKEIRGIPNEDNVQIYIPML